MLIESRRAAALGTLVAALAGCLLHAGAASARTAAPDPWFGPHMGIALSPATPDPVAGISIPVVYHGGPVMNTGTVTVHTIFWAPSGYFYNGPPAAGVLGYVAMIQQFFTDVAHDSGSHSNVFSMLDQYGDEAASGHYSIAYNPATDSITDSDAYPPASKQCPSPAGIGTCLTDVDVAAEIDHVIQTHDSGGYSLHDVWEVFLPPNVDECSGLGVCGTTEYEGYHSLADVGHGTFFYAVIISSLIEGPPLVGADPEGNPEAESAINTSAHETMELMTNPEGNAWMDPNGFEIADKCESGPQVGQPLGYAPDGAPYNQLINGHHYEIQEIYSDAAKGCAQSSTVTADGLPLAEVTLRQFSPEVSGDTGGAKARVAVQIVLVRANDLVAEASGVTRAGGSWGPFRLLGPHGAWHGVGDDRDLLIVSYGPGGPPADVIATGAEGDPFAEAGYTDWLDLDTGFALGTNKLSVAPCAQSGVLTVTVNGVATDPPVPRCSTELDSSVVPFVHLTAASRVLLTSMDNRAVSTLAPQGALVSMTVPLGEPRSVAAVPANIAVPFRDSGMPACTAELRIGSVTCSGLVPSAHYSVMRVRGTSSVSTSARANSHGVVTFDGLPGPHPIAGGDLLGLRNDAGRVLTTLHVARLQVAIDGDRDVIQAGTCQPGDYWGEALTTEPTSDGVGEPGAAGLGTVCPPDGKAAGLSDTLIAQTDDLSGGATVTSIPELEGEAPSEDATLYGPFTAIAQTAVPGPLGGEVPTGAAVSLSITRAGSQQVAWSSTNVALPDGVAVHRLAAGVYRATWVVRDDNGDTRTVDTTFIEAG